MLSEKVLFALNNTDDSFLEEAWELLSGSVVSHKPAMRKIIRTILIAAILMALMAATAYAIVSIHQKRQQELRENLKIEENNVTSYKEYESQPQSDTSGVTLLSTVNDFFAPSLMVVSPATASASSTTVYVTGTSPFAPLSAVVSTESNIVRMT